MSTGTLDRELQTFAVDLFERSGGLADWPTTEAPGSVVVPAEIAAMAQLPADEFAIDKVAAPGTLQVGLAGEFLDVAARLLDAAVPRDGAFRIADRYLTTRDLSEKVGRTFVWQNARAKCRAAEPAFVPYHSWTLLGSLRSEDMWEVMLRFSVNAESQGIVELPNVLQEPDLNPTEPAPAPPTTYATAIAEGRRRLIAASADFVCRIEQRLDRDRKRLQNYYRALLREADSPKRRVSAPSADEIADRKRAVDLELKRKLADLNENYALRATLRPVALARVNIPALVVPIVVQRKQAFRDYNLYWNSLLKQFEPLSCSRCRRATFSATFTNEEVELLCTTCAES